MDERRRFSRIRFDAPITLTSASGEQPARLLDLSLNGVLLETGQNWTGETGEAYDLTIELSPTARVTMTLELSHIDRGRAGFSCLRIDLESLEHLRRLAELNLGDASLLQRELGELVADE